MRGGYGIGMAQHCIQISADGAKRPENCKFTMYADDIEILDVIEVIPATEQAAKAIEGVYVWKM